MPRSGDDARARLRHAALELFAEKGFDATTAAEIAARAGVTERTFFRHFPDKREVLFEGQEILGDALAKAIAEAPAGLPPLEVLRLAFAAVTGMLEANRRYSEPRQKIIAATPALQEREQAKHLAIARVVAEALERRGIGRQRSALAAQAGSAVLGFALEAWFAEPGVALGAHLDRAFSEFEALTST